MEQAISTIVFDLGGVLIDWNPRYYYRDVFKGDDAAMEDFLSTVCTQEWNHRHDEGVSFVDNATALKSRHPDKADLIDAWFTGFNKMLSGSIAGTVDVLADLDTSKIPLYALSNWSAETFHIARERFDFLKRFKGIVVSGEEKLAKPDTRLFQVLIERYALDPARALFIDDVRVNIDAAARLGFQTIHFTTPEYLRSELTRRQLLPLQRCA